MFHLLSLKCPKFSVLKSTMKALEIEETKELIAEKVLVSVNQTKNQKKKNQKSPIQNQNLRLLPQEKDLSTLLPLVLSSIILSNILGDQDKRLEALNPRRPQKRKKSVEVSS